MQLLNEAVDVSKEFEMLKNQYFIADQIIDFSPSEAKGTILFRRHVRKVRISFDDVTTPFEQAGGWEFPPDYPQDLKIPFQITFLSERSIRLEMQTSEQLHSRFSLVDVERGEVWCYHETENGVVYQSPFAQLTIDKNPFHITLSDSKGKVLVRTNHMEDTTCLHKDDPFPFGLVRNTDNTRLHFASSLSLTAGEKLFGGGESFTRLDKRGQKMVLYTKDPHGVETGGMYKPVPFLMSSKGYGVFYHTTAPLTLDVGHDSNLANIAYLYESGLDLFFFAGSPKEILEEYTALTGRSSMPPLWSFGLWMSRISYSSEIQVNEVAETLREKRVPCDVIHLDTGWFEQEWRCDYRFSKGRFPNPKSMIEHLKQNGYRVSLWQYPYFTPQNPLYPELIAKGFYVKDVDGNLPLMDVVLDFSNPEAVTWYQEKLKDLLSLGVSAIKADFGEAAPLHGQYFSGRSGYLEHNLYPYRYNQAVAEATQDATGECLIWARSAWCGSQKYPVHWGGDADNSDNAMEATLRGGLSLGLCGFSFWSHDIGGFVKQSPEELYRRWLPFGILTSHSRCHGAPPKEPWYYGEEFTDYFRTCVELKYTLMPYILEQAEICCEHGWPMLRPLFFEFPADRGSWEIEDEYLFGESILVAPLFEAGTTGREVYLPDCDWADYQTGLSYPGGRWHRIEAGQLSVILLVKKGSTIKHLPVCQSTAEMDFSKVFVKQF